MLYHNDIDWCNANVYDHKNRKYTGTHCTAFDKYKIYYSPPENKIKAFNIWISGIEYAGIFGQNLSQFYNCWRYRGVR